MSKSLRVLGIVTTIFFVASESDAEIVGFSENFDGIGEFAGFDSPGIDFRLGDWEQRKTGIHFIHGGVGAPFLGET